MWLLFHSTDASSAPNHPESAGGSSGADAPAEAGLSRGAASPALAFPLSEGSAARLALAWLQPDVAARAAELSRLARVDASFCCWLAAAGAGSGTAVPARPLAELAQRAAQLARPALWNARGCSRKQVRRWRKLAARQNSRSIHQAELAARLCYRGKAGPGVKFADAARLVALVHSAPQWLKLGRELRRTAQFSPAGSSLEKPTPANASSPVAPEPLPSGKARKLAALYATCLAPQWQATPRPEAAAGEATDESSPGDAAAIASTVALAEQRLHKSSGKQASRDKQFRRLLKSARRAGRRAMGTWRPPIGLPAEFAESLWAVVAAPATSPISAGLLPDGTLPGLLEQEKLESLAEFAAGAGHEINNPLAVISGRAQLLLKSEQDATRRRDLLNIRAQAVRIHEMIAGMMFFARPPQPQRTKIDLSQLLSTLRDDLSEQATARGIELEFLGIGTPLPLVADGAQVAAALRAVYDNGLFALAEGGRIVTEVLPLRVGTPASGAQAADSARQPHAFQISITDTGPGISPEIRRHLFDPYFSGRQSGRGLGMGLSKAWRIVQQHAGSLEVRSESGHGATFVITLPVAGARSLPTDSPTNDTPAE